MNYDILPSNEVKEVESRRYVNPNLSVQETNTFIDNFRNTQQANNSQIVQQARNLGTQVPSNLGGLVGSEGYWTSRYQTPQTNTALQDLRTAAQSTALKQALANEKAAWDKRYNEAYRNYQKRQNDKTNAQLSGNNGATTGGVNLNDTTNPVSQSPTLTAEGGMTMVPEIDTETGGLTGRVWVNGQWVDQNVHYKDPNMAAGMSSILDLFTGKYNYSLPGDIEVELGGNDEQLKLGTDGNYYIWDTQTNKYYPVTGDSVPTSGTTPGGGRWWKK